MAVVTKTLSPHTTGHECASPGIGVFQRMFVPLVASQVVGVGLPSATPEAFGPRNDGQFCARAIVATLARRTITSAMLQARRTLLIMKLENINTSRTMLGLSAVTWAPAGVHPMPRGQRRRSIGKTSSGDPTGPPRCIAALRRACPTGIS